MEEGQPTLQEGLHPQSRSLAPSSACVDSYRSQDCQGNWQHWRCQSASAGVAAPGVGGWRALTGSWPAVTMIVCTTIMFLAAAVICLLFLLRPLLKRLETLAVAAELAAKSLDKASVEFEQASAIINTELPDTLDSVERASLEFEELGQSLNGLTGGLKRSRPLATRQRGKKAAVEAGEAAAAVKDAGRGQDRGPVGAIQASTANSMRKVAQDISALTAALTPAMEAWRKRISFITELFEAASKEGSPSSKPAKLPAPAVAASANEKDRTAKNIEIGKSWIAEWRKQQQQLADSSGQGLEPQDVSQAASNLVQVAAEAAAVASSSLPVIAADASDPQAQRSADGLQQAATAAQSLLEEAVSTASEVDGLMSPGDPEAAGDVSRQDVDSQPRTALERDSEADGEAGRREEALEERRRAAQAVFAALSKAEEAASAAAAAGGELESALQQAERHAGGSWWGWKPTGHTSSRTNGSDPKQGLDNQEEDGMAYPSSPFIAATRTLDLDDEEEGARSPTARSGKAGPVAAK